MSLENKVWRFVWLNEESMMKTQSDGQTLLCPLEVSWFVLMNQDGNWGSKCATVAQGHTHADVSPFTAAFLPHFLFLHFRGRHHAAGCQ